MLKLKHSLRYWVPFIPLMALLCRAGAVFAEVDAKLPPPPKFDDGQEKMKEMGANWDLKPEAWLAFLQSTKTLQAVPFDRGVNLPVSDHVEAVLRREGFVVENLQALQIRSSAPPEAEEKPGESMAARMARYLRQKVAVRVNDALYVTVTPRDGLSADELSKRALAVFQGQPFDRIGTVGALLWRMFPAPTGTLCARITFLPQAVNQDLFRLVDISIASELTNLIHRPPPPQLDRER